MKLKCPQCPKEYQSQKDLDKHMKKIHGLSPVKLKKISEERKSDLVKKCLELLKEE